MRVITTYNAGPFAAGAALASFDRIGACHIPMATGNTERVLMAIERLQPEAVVATPSYAKYLAETGDLAGLERHQGARRRRARRRRARLPRALQEAWGARVTEAMGIGDIGVSLWGECEHQDGMHLGAHGFVHPELIDPETEQADRR